MPQLLWLLVAFLLGVLVEWLLEIFFFRRRMFEQMDSERAVVSKWRSQYEKNQAALGACETELGNARAIASKLQADLNACANARATLEKEQVTLQARISQLENDLDAARKNQSIFKTEMQARETELSQLRADLDGLINQNKNLTADVAKFTAGAATATATIKALEDDKAGLEKQIADLKAQLGKANADLSTLTNACAQLETKLKDRDAELAKLRVDFDAHVAQNKNLSAEVAQFTASVATATATIKALEEDKAGLQARIEQMKGELDRCASARASLEADLKSRDAEIEKLRLQAVSAPVAATPALSTETEFARLRNRSADDETPFETACPQHLSDVKGIGSVFETRLYESGIGTYWELSQLSDADLKRILKLTDLQATRIDFNAIRSDARRLAKETKSLGRKWNQSAPDDFEPIQGIGHTFEKRLYDAGICTYEALAAVTVEILDEICQAPVQFKPDYAAWIEQAKVLAAQKTRQQPKA